MIVAAAVALAACSGGTPRTDRSEGTDPSTSEGAGATTTQPTTTVPGPLPVSLEETVEVTGTLRLGFGGTVALDPVGASPAAAPDMIVTDLLYDTLTEIDENGRAQPGLATFSVVADPEESDDDDEDGDGDGEEEVQGPLVWRFELRDGVTFADGTPVTANDVHQSLERVMQRGGASLAAIRLSGIESITTTGSTTIDITLTEPSAVLPEILASPLYGITDATTVATYSGGAVRPNPSGDYVVEAQAETELVLARRDGTGPERILLDMFATEDAAFDAFTTGAVDWSPVPAERFEEAIATAGAGGLVPFTGGLYLAIDPGQAPLDDRAVRRAIALSIDRTSLVDKVYGPAAQPLLGVIPAGVPGGAEDECRGPCVPDRERARTVVERVFPDGQNRPLRLLVDDTPVMRSVGNTLGEHIEASGFDVEVSSEDAVTYEQLIAAGQQQMFLYGWLGIARTPADYLLPMFESSSPDNVTGYRNDNVDALLAEAVRTPDPARRDQLWAEAEQIVLDDAPVVPVVQFRTISVVASRITGLGIRIDGTMDVSGVTFVDS